MVIKIPYQVNRALEILFSNGFSAYIVGGAVRDSFMGKVADDWDIACSASPEITCRLFSERGFDHFENGIKHGTVTVIIDGMCIEITTFRIEKGYSDNRHPDSVFFSDKIEEDLSRRDFTINAIAYSPENGTVDLFGGLNDIKAGIVRCVGDPDKRFEQDALRMLRALRFSSVLGFEIEENTARSIGKNYKLLAEISRERVYSELKKMLCGMNAQKVLIEWSDVIFFILPELAPMKGCTQNHERHIYDVWEHTAVSLGKIRPVPELRLAMLLHDSGKPDCKTTDENGIDHFYDHGKIGAITACRVMESLKASSASKKKVCELVEYHDFLPDRISKPTYKKYISKLGIETVRELFEVREADISAQSPEFLEQGLLANRKGIEVIDEIEKDNLCLKITDLEINGNDLVSLGIPPSKRTGEILKILFNEVLEEKTANQRKALLSRASEIAAKYGNYHYMSKERRKHGNSKN